MKEKGDSGENQDKKEKKENVMNTQGILLLDNTYQPLRVVSTRRAVGLMLKGGVESVTDDYVEVPYASSAMQIPLVLRLGYAIKIPFRHDTPKCTRRGVLARDGYECQFIVPGEGACTAHATTVDHIHPKSEGGEKSAWENLVAACERHNHRKANRFLKDLGWKLKRQPFAPKGTMRVVAEATQCPEAWKPYLVTA